MAGDQDRTSGPSWKFVGLKQSSLFGFTLGYIDGF